MKELLAFLITELKTNTGLVALLSILITSAFNYFINKDKLKNETRRFFASPFIDNKVKALTDLYNAYNEIFQRLVYSKVETKKAELIALLEIKNNFINTAELKYSLYIDDDLVRLLNKLNKNLSKLIELKNKPEIEIEDCNLYCETISLFGDFQYALKQILDPISIKEFQSTHANQFKKFGNTTKLNGALLYKLIPELIDIFKSPKKLSKLLKIVKKYKGKDFKKDPPSIDEVEKFMTKLLKISETK